MRTSIDTSSGNKWNSLFDAIECLMGIKKTKGEAVLDTLCDRLDVPRYVLCLWPFFSCVFNVFLTKFNFLGNTVKSKINASVMYFIFLKLLPSYYKIGVLYSLPYPRDSTI